MTHPFDEWQLTELAKLGQADRPRAERALNALWAAMPGLYEDLARSAGLQPVDGESEEVLTTTYALVETNGSSIACLVESRIAVWEIVRAHRRTGSIDALSTTFPSVDRDELEAAIDYGHEHEQEIDRLIERYEAMIEQRRAQYPYAR